MKARIRAESYRTVVPVVLALLALQAEAQTRNGFDLSDSLVDPEKIVAGGPPRDGIPSIDDPGFLSAEDADFLRPEDRVIGVSYEGVTKAYPVRILNWHEIVNDRFAERSVLVTYCPLCRTGIVFDVTRTGIDPEFGVSGLLYNSDVLLYDRQTGSLWSQIAAKAISGPEKGTVLQSIAARHTNWRDWHNRYPDTLVLSPDTGFRRDYGSSPYLSYERSPRLMFGVEHENDTYPRKSLVLGLNVDGEVRAYPFPELRRQGRSRFEDEIGKQRITIVFNDAENTAYALSPEGKELPSVLAYWFAWYAFHPDTEIFRVGS